MPPLQRGRGQSLEVIMMIIRKDNGKTDVISYMSVKKDGREYLYPQMIDITDIKHPNEIYNLVMEYESEDEWNF
jgi:hypothetical protein